MLFAVFLIAIPAGARGADRLAGTAPLDWEGDLAARMVEGIDRYLTRGVFEAPSARAALWRRDFSSPDAYSRSLEPNRQRLARVLGAVDARPARVELEFVASADTPALVGSGPGYRVYAVRWPALPGVEGEGLLLEPDRPPAASVVALPDCDWAPEQLAGLEPGLPTDSQFARRLAESGCRVLVPALIDRRSEWSELPGARGTNLPHREFLYRAGFELGRHLIGLEVQKVRAALDFLSAAPATLHPPVPAAATRRRKAPGPTSGSDERAGEPGPFLGVIGYGEGGLLALHTAALDPRVTAVVVSGYFGPREEVWREPIYRNVWALLREFGDAEVASMVAPRSLVIEACAVPAVAGPPSASSGRTGAAPGRLATPSLAAVRHELERARQLVDGLAPRPTLEFVASNDGIGPCGTDAALRAFLRALQVQPRLRRRRAPPVPSRSRILRSDGEAAAALPRESPDVQGPQLHAERRRRQFDQLLEYTQRLMRESEFTRRTFWAKADTGNAQKWESTARPYREYLWDEVIGRLPPASLPVDPRSRPVYDEPAFRGYEVVLDVYPDVFAYGILLVPKDVQPGERRPAVVCQHGLEGRPQDLADLRTDHPAYHRYAARLAERGFIVFAPQNPYIGGDRFRVLQRKANPLKLSLFSFIVRQHERILEWLVSLPYVDPHRIGFYGLSYGGKTAVRVPALLDGYALSICSADYNEWIWKNVSARHGYSYLFTGEYEMPEFDLANTFNYAELSWLIFPRPFMVERGHEDGVAPDEWVAYEYARTRRHYVRLRHGDRTEIEFFNGPHTIHGVGTFEFLHRHLNWPVRAR